MDDRRRTARLEPKGAADTPLRRRLRRQSLLLGFAAILLAALVLAGWIRGLPTLRGVHADLTPAVPDAALGIGLLGLAILCLGARRPLVRGPLAQACAAAAALVGVVTLVEYRTGADLGVDRLLFARVVASPGIPDRPAPNTALLLLAAGVGTLLLAARRDRPVRAGQALAVVVGLFSVLALIGYAYGIPGLYGFPAYTAMAIPTVIGLLLVSAGMLTAVPERGLVSVLSGGDPGGYIARRLLPSILIVPVLLGWLRLQGERAGLYGAAVGVALMVAGTIVLLSALVWWNARAFQDVDRKRRQAEEALRESELRFRSLAENAAEAIVTIDADDRIVFANAGAARVFGYPLEALYDTSFRALIPERYREAHAEGIRRYLATGQRRIPWDGVELPGLRSDGTEVMLEVSFGEHVTDGRHFFNGIMRDITERKHAEAERERLLERERQARGEAERRAREEAALREATAAVSATYSIEEGIQRIADAAYVATGADGAFVERLDLEHDAVEVVAVAGERIPDVGSRIRYAGSLASRVLRQDEPILLHDVDEADVSLPVWVRERCGRCSLVVLPLQDASEAIGALVLVRSPDRGGFRPDEAERAHTFANLASIAFRKMHLLKESEDRREELEEVMESRARLMRGFSHDVKNPLGAADGHLQLLEMGVRGELTGEQRETIERSRRSIGAALRLIDDLVELARTEAGRIELRRVPVDLRRLVEEMAEEYRAQAESKGLRLEVELPEALPMTRSDDRRLRQILGNLISNAVKYTERGRIAIRVAEAEHGAPRPGRWLAASVSDTGPGIPPEQRHLLFREFSRLRPGGEPGAGLGLAISQRVAEAVGGKITVESVPGAGSTFTLWVPLADERQD